MFTSLAREEAVKTAVEVVEKKLAEYNIPAMISQNIDNTIRHKFTQLEMNRDSTSWKTELQTLIDNAVEKYLSKYIERKVAMRLDSIEGSVDNGTYKAIAAWRTRILQATHLQQSEHNPFSARQAQKGKASRAVTCRVCGTKIPKETEHLTFGWVNEDLVREGRACAQDCWKMVTARICLTDCTPSGMPLTPLDVHPQWKDYDLLRTAYLPEDQILPSQRKPAVFTKEVPHEGT